MENNPAGIDVIPVQLANVLRNIAWPPDVSPPNKFAGIALFPVNPVQPANVASNAKLFPDKIFANNPDGNEVNPVQLWNVEVNMEYPAAVML